jgi:PAS domain S-box-containing protein
VSSHLVGDSGETPRIAPAGSERERSIQLNLNAVPERPVEARCSRCVERSSPAIQEVRGPPFGLPIIPAQCKLLTYAAMGAVENVRKREVEEEAVDLLTLLIEQVIDYAIFVVDKNGNIASWNPGAERIKGYAPDEIIGRPYSVFFTEADRAAGKPDAILSHSRTHGRYEEEGWRVRKDGSRFWASVVVTALHDRRGAFRGFAKITRDLTERRQADDDARLAAAEQAARRQAELDEREMRWSRDQLDLILRSITEGVTVQTPERKLIFANDAAAQLCGFASADAFLAASREEILGKYEILREDGAPFPLDELPGRLALQGKPSNAVVRFRVKRTGEERWSFVSGAPVLDENGNVDLSVTVFREFTDRRRSEQAWQFLADASAALAASLDYQATLKQVAELAVPTIADWSAVDILTPDGSLERLAVAHVDPSKRELAQEWRRRWPPPPEGPGYQAIRSGLPQLLAEITDAMIEAGTPDPEQRRLAFQLGLRSAMVVPLIVGNVAIGTLSFVTAESGRLYGAQDLILAREIGRRASLAIENARAYTDAREAVRTRDNFLAIASHELRTPLSALSVLVSSLVRAAGSGRLLKLTPQALSDRMAKAERQTTQLARLVDRLLDVSRLSTCDLALERERTDLADLTRDAISRYEDAAAETGSRIELSIAGPAVGWWDRSRLDQVVTNLVGNAVKYGQGAPITVSVSAGSSGHVRLTVRDEGPGIPLEHQERIFGQFERANDSESLPGMGLGLWLVRRIVTAHGGAINVDSAPGRGATFTVLLPVGEQASVKPTETSPTVSEERA